MIDALCGVVVAQVFLLTIHQVAGCKPRIQYTWERPAYPVLLIIMIYTGYSYRTDETAKLLLIAAVITCGLLGLHMIIRMMRDSKL